MTSTWLVLAAGLAILVVGAELLVRGASRLAWVMGVPSLVIGLTIVAYGTSAPELAVGLSSVLHGQADLAIGNAVGSNIFNVLFILGLSALIVPLQVSRQLVRLDVPLMVAVAGLLWILGQDGRLSHFEGLLLMAVGLSVAWLQIREGRKEAAGEDVPKAATKGWRTTAHSVFLVLAGLGLLVLGSRWLVAAATDLARAFGVSELVVGLTVVAAGTSLPEVATSVVAALRGERDIAVGNVVGSNLFNVLWALGLPAAIGPGPGLVVSAQALSQDIPIMIAVCLACLPIFFTGYTIARWEGALFFAYYVAYTVVLVLGARSHPALRSIEVAMLGFVLPLTALTLVVLSVRFWRSERAKVAEAPVET